MNGAASQTRARRLDARIADLRGQNPRRAAANSTARFLFLGVVDGALPVRRRSGVPWSRNTQVNAACASTTQAIALAELHRIRCWEVVGAAGSRSPA